MLLECSDQARLTKVQEKISEAESKLSSSKRWSNCWYVVASNVNKNCKFAQYALHFGLLLRNCDIVGRVFCVQKNGFLFGHGISQACSFRRYPLNKAMDAIEFPSEIGAAIYFGARAGQGCISHDFPTQGGAKGQQNHQHRCVGDNQMMRWWRVHFVTYHSSDSEWPLTRNRTYRQAWLCCTGCIDYAKKILFNEEIKESRESKNSTSIDHRTVRFNLNTFPDFQEAPENWSQPALERQHGLFQETRALRVHRDAIRVQQLALICPE